MSDKRFDVATLVEFACVHMMDDCKCLKPSDRLRYLDAVLNAAHEMRRAEIDMSAERRRIH